MMLYNHLRYACAMPEVLEVCCPRWRWLELVGDSYEEIHPSKPKQALHAAAGMDPTSKMIIVVDEDIDPKDPEMVMWAIEFLPCSRTRMPKSSLVECHCSILRSFADARP